VYALTHVQRDITARALLSDTLTALHASVLWYCSRTLASANCYLYVAYTTSYTVHERVMIVTHYVILVIVHTSWYALTLCDIMTLGMYTSMHCVAVSHNFAVL
jgi:hypothetical protein